MRTLNIAIPPYDQDDDKALIKLRDPQYVSMSDEGFPEVNRAYLDAVAGENAGAEAIDAAMTAAVEWSVVSAHIPGHDGGLPVPLVSVLWRDFVSQIFAPTSLATNLLAPE